MHFELLFLGGLGLLLLAFVSFVGAWAHSTRPVTAIIFASVGVALLIVVARERPRGLYSLGEIPELITRLLASILALL